MSLKEWTNNANLVVVLIATVGFGIVFLSNLTANDNINGAAETAINTGITGIGEYMDWIGLAILLGVFIYFLTAFKRMNSGKD